MIQGVRPSFHPDQRFVFQSRSDRWAVVAVRNGSFVRRRKSQGHANMRQIRSLLFAGSNPACTSLPAWPPSSNLAPTLLRPREADVGCWHGPEIS